MKNPSNYIFSLGEDFYDFLLEKKEIIPMKISEIKELIENDKKKAKKISNKDLNTDLSVDVVTE